MANETLHHRYREITDDPAEGENASYGWCASLLLFIISLPLSLVIFLILLIFCSWQLSVLISLGIFVLIILFGLFSKYGYDKTSPRLYEAERAKRFLGFDFGNNFRLRKTGSHHYEEILLDFNEEEFKLLEEFCKSQKEYIEMQDGTKSSIIHIIPYIEKGEIGHICTTGERRHYSKQEITPGFTKEEINYDLKVSHDWISSILTMEVDYEARTLKFSYSGF